MGTFFLLSRYNLAAILTREAPICEPNIGMTVTPTLGDYVWELLVLPWPLPS